MRAFSLADAPPSAVFSSDRERPDSAVACFVAADHTFDPTTGTLRPALGVRITGIERLPIANSFIAEMVGCIGMVQFQSLFECAMAALCNCESTQTLLRIQPMQPHKGMSEMVE